MMKPYPCPKTSPWGAIQHKGELARLRLGRLQRAKPDMTRAAQFGRD